MLSLLFFVAHAQTPPPSPWEKSIFADGRGGGCTQASFFCVWMVDVLQRRDQNSGKLLFFCSDVYEAQNTNQSGLTSLLSTIPHCLIT